MALFEETLFGKENKIRQAITVLRANEPPEGYYVAFSGGKDSVVIYWLTKMARVKCTYHYHFTTIDPPEVVAFVRSFYSDVILSHPGSANTMWSLIIKKGFPPTRRFRYCCAVLKECHGKDRFKILGIRAEESAKRKGRRVVDQKRQEINPIYHWREDEVWAFIKRYNLPYCALYDQGFDRLGCVGCPLQGTAGMIRDFKRWPLYGKAYLNTFAKMLAQRNHQGRPLTWSTPMDVMHWWLDDTSLRYKFTNAAQPTFW